MQSIAITDEIVVPNISADLVRYCFQKRPVLMAVPGRAALPSAGWLQLRQWIPDTPQPVGHLTYFILAVARNVA